jgi:hypothetical protein
VHSRVALLVIVALRVCPQQHEVFFVLICACEETLLCLYCINKRKINIKDTRTYKNMHKEQPDLHHLLQRLQTLNNKPTDTTLDTVLYDWFTKNFTDLQIYASGQRTTERLNTRVSELIPISMQREKNGNP